MSKEKSTIKREVGLSNWIIFAVLIIYSLSMLMLFAWGFFTSVKGKVDWIKDKVWLPEGMPWSWSWSNYLDVINNFSVDVTTSSANVSVNIFGQLVNTLLYSGGSAIIITMAYCIMGYLVCKYNYFFSKIIYTFVLVTMVIPIIGSTPSTLLLLHRLNLFDTWLGNFITKFNFLGMYFLVVHASFSSVPNEFYEAAKVDGANEYQIFFQIMIPMVMPTCLTICLIKFIEFWNDYQTPLLFMPTHPTLAYGVYELSIKTELGMSTPPKRLAACMMLAIPILILFVAFRNKILGNVTMGGVKE